MEKNESYGYKIRIFTKFSIFLVLFLFIMLVDNVYLLTTVFIFLIILFLMNPCKYRKFKLLMKTITFLCFTSIFGLFKVNGKIIFSFGPILITSDGLNLVLLTFMKLSSMIFLSFILSSNLSSYDMMNILKVLFIPIPVCTEKKRDLLFILTASYEFTPTLLRKFEKLVEHEKKRSFFSKLKLMPRMMKKTFEESTEKVREMMESESREIHDDFKKLDG